MSTEPHKAPKIGRCTNPYYSAGEDVGRASLISKHTHNVRKNLSTLLNYITSAQIVVGNSFETGFKVIEKNN